MSAVVIRLATADDLSCLGAIEQSGADTFTAHGQPLADGSPPAPPDHWDDACEAGLLWVADDPACGPVGFLAAEITDDGLYVAEVDVLMQHQRKGLGRRLMAAAIGEARGRRLPAVTLTTFRDIPWNAPFYASMGFIQLGPNETSPHLATTLATETARGFEGRCAMRLPL